MFFVQKLKFFFSFLNRRGLFERASEIQKPCLLKDILIIFKKNLSLGWTSHIFLHTFVSQIVLNTIHTYFFFSNQKFYEQEITKCIIVQRNNYLFVTSTPSKNNTQTRSLYSFFVPPKSKFLPLESYSPKKWGSLVFYSKH